MVGVEGFGVCDEAGIEWVAGERGAVADDDEFFAGASHGYVHAADVGQEAYVTIGIAAHHADADDVSLLALEAVDGIDGYTGGVFLQKRTVGEQFVEHMYLLFVGGYDGDGGKVIWTIVFAESGDQCSEVF